MDTNQEAVMVSDAPRNRPKKRRRRPGGSAAPEARPPKQESPSPWRPSSTWVLGSAGSLLLWAALPPLGIWPLGWLACIAWLELIRRPQLESKRPYLILWACGIVFWIGVLHGIVLAHWANYFGVLGLGLYYGAWLPLFVGISRIAVHRLRVPLVVAAPIAWVALEVVRGRGHLGFSGALLAHTQVNQLPVIQVSDIAGAYGLSCIMILVAVCLLMIFRGSRSQRLLHASLAITVLAGTLAYGQWRLGQPTNPNQVAPARVALIQGSIDTEFVDDEGRTKRILQQYVDLTHEARASFGVVDLLVWPESMYPFPNIEFDPTARSFGPDVDIEAVRDAQMNSELGRKNLAKAMNMPRPGEAQQPHQIPLLLGIITYRFDGGRRPQRFNDALLLDPDGKTVAQYQKMHPVAFGEYLPFGDWMPWLYALTPMDGGLSKGARPVAFENSQMSFSPSICFESIVPHLIRDQVLALEEDGQPVDVLLNITNDGWFWGSSILDVHFHCGVFRAIENRKPLLIAANTGFSASIDGNGQVLQKGPRRETGVLLAEVVPDGRSSPYHLIGDWPAWACVWLSGLALAVGVVGRFRKGE